MSAAHAAVRLGRAESWFVMASLLWLLVGPRVAVPGGLGIRYEDLLFVALAFVVVRTRGRRRMLVRIENLGIAAVTAASLVSTAVGVAAGRVEPALSALYALRPLEYWIVYPTIVLLLVERAEPWTGRLRVLLAGVTILQTAFALAQYLLGLQIGFSHQAYSRGAGLTAGPYELGAISAALLIFWLAQRRFVLAIIAAAGLLVSISRISLIGAVAGLAVLGVLLLIRRLRRRRGRPSAPLSTRAIRTVAATGSALVVVVVALTLALLTPAGSRLAQQATAPITDRFGSTSITGSWTAAEGLAARIPPVETAAQYDSIAFLHIFDHVDAERAADVGAEASNLVRFFRWHLILDNLSSPDRIGLGLGPSFVGGSVDGSYLRFLADGGVLGVLAWAVLIVGWFRRTPPWMAGVVVSMLVGALFIDIVYALRAMVLFWALLAVARQGGALAPPVPLLTRLRRRRADIVRAETDPQPHPQPPRFRGDRVREH